MGQAISGSAIPGVGATLEAQLDSISIAQARIKLAVETDEVDELDELVAEKGARLEALLSRLLRLPKVPGGVYARLGLLLEQDEQLAGLIRRRLMVLRNELRRACEAAQLVQTYSQGLGASPGVAPEAPVLQNLSA
jgi:hypothetical protein